MYKHYFGFNETPFSIAPDPRYLFMSEMHQEALAHLNYGLIPDSCITLLTGEVGTGKTTICRCFLEQLDPGIEVAIIINPKLTAKELLATICDEFQIAGIEPQATTKTLIDHLNERLLRSHAQDRQALIVIDEAQNLDYDVLEMLRLLTNLETNRQKLVKIFLLGQSELADLLSRPELTQINQRITSRFHLKGLKYRDLETYIKHRICVAGGGRSPLFSKEAIKRIFAASGGIPRLINSLCDRSLLGAYSEGKDQVNEKIVRNAAREILGDTSGRKSYRKNHRFSVSGLLLVMVALGFWVGIIQQIFKTEPTPAPDLTRVPDTPLKSRPATPSLDITSPEVFNEDTLRVPALSPMPSEPTPPSPLIAAGLDRRIKQGEHNRIFIKPLEIND